MCGDYCPINKKTKSDHYMMPTPKQLCGTMGYAQIFSTLNLRSGYQ